MSLMVALFGLLKKRANHRINTVNKERGGTSLDNTHIHMSGDCGWLDHASWRVTGSDRTDDESLRSVLFYSFRGSMGPAIRYESNEGRYATCSCPTRAESSLSFEFKFVVSKARDTCDDSDG